MKQTITSVIAMLLAVLYSIGLLTAPPVQPASAQEAAAATGISTEYENRLFDDSFVHAVEIEMPEASWESLKASALYKEYYDCNVTIDGETFYHVGVHTKGNTTLIQSIIREWDRYSLVLDFGAFNESQRYYGLDKVALNNNICDSSFLRDYLCYDMMRSMGVPTPLCSFVQLKLNGEVIGLYTAVESLSESFALRNYGTQHGQLYKPEQIDIAGMITGTEKNATLRLSELSAADGTVDACQFLGVDDVTVGLQYQGEALSNYDAIWNNAVFKTGKSDKRRLVEAIRVINQEEDASSALNVDELLRYFAVNTFILNDDCYTSYAGHNYGLYEKDGRLSLVPWDYDHALGCTGAASGTSNWTDYINTPIDEPLIDTTLAERPLLNCLLSNEKWRAQYHAYLDEFIRDYIESGEFARKAEAAATMIRPYVEADPTSGVMYSRSFGVTLLTPCMVTDLAILTVTSNVVLSLGMVGALSIVRFRTAIKEPLDISFLFWSIVVGIMLGAGMIPLAVFGSIIVGIVLLVFSRQKKSSTPYILVLQCADESAEDAAMRKPNERLKKYVLKSKTVGAEGIEATIEVNLTGSETKFLNELQGLEGVRHATLVSYNGEYMS